MDRTWWPQGRPVGHAARRLAFRRPHVPESGAMGIRDTLRTAWRLDAAAPLAGLPYRPPAPGQVESPWADTSNLESATWASLFDNVDTLPVTRGQGTSIPGASRGRDLICVSAARLPFYAMNAAGQLPVQPRCIVQPEPDRPRFVTMLWTVDSMLWYGYAVWLVIQRYAEDLRPRAFRLVPPSQIGFNSSGQVETVFGSPVANPADVIRFDGPHEGVLTRGRDTIRDARRLALAYAKATRQPVPNVELHQVGGDPMSDDDVKNLIAQWAAARAGENGGVAFTNQNLEAKYPAVGWGESLLTVGREAVALDMARHMGLPAWAVDAATSGDSLTYSNVPSRSRELIDYTLAGYLEAIVGRLSMDDILAAGIWSAYSTDVLTNGTFLERMQGYQAAITAGIYSADQCRAIEAGSPVEGPTTA